MGTYLHPSNLNESLVEKLAGVSAGTAERLKQFEEQNPRDYKDPYKEYEIHSLLKANAELSSLDSFLSFGWGKLNNKALAVLKRWNLSPEAGFTDKPIVVRALIASMGIDLNGVSLSDLESLNWG